MCKGKMIPLQPWTGPQGFRRLTLGIRRQSTYEYGKVDSPTYRPSLPPGDTLRLKCDDTRAETRFRLSAKRTSPFKSLGASVQSTTGSRGVRFSGSNAGYTMFRGSVKSTGYPQHLNRREGGGQFSRLLAAEVCASAVVMLDTPCSEVV